MGTGLQISKFLILVCFIQGSTSESIGDVLNDLGPKIINLGDQITETVDAAPTQISSIQEKITKSVSTAENNLITQIDQLGYAVDKATSEANAQGKNIDKCTSDETSGLLALDLNGLEYCRATPSITDLNSELQSLEDEQQVLSTAVDQCLLQNPADVPAFRKCVEKKIQAAQNLYDGFTSDLQGFKAALPACQACIERTLGNLDLAIDDVSHQFKVCVNNILG